jgi:hypothetical protein
MKTSVPALGVLLLTIATGHLACEGERAAEEASGVREPAAPAEASGLPEPSEDAAPAAAPEASEPVEAERVVAYDSETHGAVQVNGVSANPVDYFDVLRDGERAFAGNPRLLNNAVEVPPGTYAVDVNRSQRTVTVAAGGKVVLWTGDLVVRGEPSSAYWYPMQGEERMVTANPALLGKARALFPGTYAVFVHTSVTVPDHDLGVAEVVAGRTTVLEHQSSG